jgi:hypothetical protein
MECERVRLGEGETESAGKGKRPSDRNHESTDNCTM